MGRSATEPARTTQLFATVALLVAGQVYFMLNRTDFILWSLIIVAAVYSMNYYLLLKHENMNLAFTITIFSHG